MRFRRACFNRMAVMRDGVPRATMLFTSALLLLALLPGAGLATITIKYTVSGVGHLGGGYTYARAINESGQVAGYSFLANAPACGFLTAPNQPINRSTDSIGTLGDGVESNAMALNEVGQVAGWSGIPPRSSYVSHAVRTGPALPMNPATDDLGGLGGNQAIGAGINDFGTVVGYATTAAGEYHAFCVPQGRQIDAATDDLGREIGGISYAHSINNVGQVVGYYVNSSNRRRAYRTAPGQAINPATDDLGALGGRGSLAYDINELGQVVGSADINMTSGVCHAFRTAPNQPINPATDDLGTLPGYVYSEARAVNVFGHVVGRSSNLGSDLCRAFVHDGVAMYDLNALVELPAGCVLKEALDINDRGQIVGRAVMNGGTCGFVLTPVVPEPSSAVLLIPAGLVLLGSGRPLLGRNAQRGQR